MDERERVRIGAVIEWKDNELIFWTDLQNILFEKFHNKISINLFILLDKRTHIF